MTQENSDAVEEIIKHCKYCYNDKKNDNLELCRCCWCYRERVNKLKEVETNKIRQEERIPTVEQIFKEIEKSKIGINLVDHPLFTSVLGEDKESFRRLVGMSNIYVDELMKIVKKKFGVSEKDGNVSYSRVIGNRQDEVHKSKNRMNQSSENTSEHCHSGNCICSKDRHFEDGECMGKSWCYCRGFK